MGPDFQASNHETTHVSRHFWRAMLRMCVVVDFCSPNPPRFRDEVEAWRAARGVHSVKKLYDHSPFNTTWVQWAILFAEASGWQRVPSQLAHLVRCIVRGFGQSRINEQCNRVLRDAEIRDNASKAVKMVSLWEQPLQHDLLGAYDRRHMQPHTQASPPPANHVERWFTPGPVKMTDRPGASEGELSNTKLRNEWSGKLAKITEQQRWLTFDPESFQEMIAEHRLLCTLHRLQNWTLIADSWRSRLLPEGQFVINEVEGQTYFVCRSYDAGVVLWPAVPHSQNLWALSAKVTQLVWAHCFDVEQPFKVLPTEILSPLHMQLRFHEAAGVAVRQVGGPQSLLAWQCDHAFANLSETVLKHIITEELCDDLPTSSGGNFKSELTLAIMKAMRPKWIAAEAPGPCECVGGGSGK